MGSTGPAVEQRRWAVRLDSAVMLVDLPARHYLPRRAFADGFARQPETGGELADATRLAVKSIEDEPWDDGGRRDGPRHPRLLRNSRLRS